MRQSRAIMSHDFISNSLPYTQKSSSQNRLSKDNFFWKTIEDFGKNESALKITWFDPTKALTIFGLFLKNYLYRRTLFRFSINESPSMHLERRVPRPDQRKRDQPRHFRGGVRCRGRKEVLDHQELVGNLLGWKWLLQVGTFKPKVACNIFISILRIPNLEGGKLTFSEYAQRPSSLNDYTICQMSHANLQIHSKYMFHSRPCHLFYWKRLS